MAKFGTKSSLLKNGQINGVTCPNCQNETAMTYAVYGKYAFFGILPFFPLKRLSFSECTSCKKTFELNDLNNAISDKIERDIENNGKAKYPVWMYSGLIVIPLIFVGGYLYKQNRESNTADYAKAPKKGDLFVVKEANEFTTFRIDEVSKDSVFFTVNDYVIGSSSKISRIDKPENYTNQKGALSISEVQDYVKKDSIVAIERD